MPKTVNGTMRYDIKDPADAQLLVDSGVIWSRSGPATLDIVVQHIVAGKVARVPEKETPEATALINSALGEEPAAIEPVQPPIADAPLA